MAEILSNRIRTTLDGAINSSVTSLTATDASDFPATGDFRIRIGTEIIKVLGVTGNVFSPIVRAAEPLDGVQTAVSHADDDEIRLVITAGALQEAFGASVASKLRVMYRGDDLALADTDPVSTWPSSLDTFHDLESSGGNRPAFAVGTGPNGADWVDFATGKYLLSTAMDLMGDGPSVHSDVFCVFKGGASTNMVWSAGNPSNDRSVFLYVVDSTHWAGVSYNGTIVNVPTTIANWQLATVQVRGGAIRTWLDGVFQERHLSPVIVDLAGFVMGRLSGLGASFNGGIAELRIYRDLSDSEIDGVNTELTTYYAL